MEKLDHKQFEPLAVNRRIETRAYELELPPRWTIHPVFNVRLLESYREDPIGHPVARLPMPDIVDNAPSWVISEVVDSQ